MLFDLYFQSELEHRKPKSRYKRTDRKLFVRQLAQIERREARLRKIRARHAKDGRVGAEKVAATPQEHHHIGVSQNQFEHIGSFLRIHGDDPATQVSPIKYHGWPYVKYLYGRTSCRS